MMTKKLDQSVFDRPDCPDWARSAAVGGDGKAYYYASSKKYLEACVPCVGHRYYWDYTDDCRQSLKIWMLIGSGYDTTDWQNSAIDREV